jgi:hypothetical protein
MPLPRHRSYIEDQHVAITANVLDRGVLEPQQPAE